MDDSLDVVEVGVHPPHPARDVVDGQSVRPAELRGDDARMVRPVQANPPDVRRQAPVRPVDVAGEVKAKG